MLPVLMALAGCDQKLGFSGGDEEGAGQLDFGGIKSINITPDGRYVLVWDHARSIDDIATVSYEIYMDKWSALPASVPEGALAAQITAGAEGVPVGARFADMADDEAPAGKGVLLTSVRGVRSYVLDERIQPHLIYAFQVRSVSSDGTRDNNPHVLIYSADFNKIAFSGISGLSQTPAGKLLLEWMPPTDFGNLSASDITYEIYIDSTQESVDAVVSSGSLPLNPGVTGLKLADPAWGQMVDLPPERLPSSTAGLTAERKGGRFYELETALSPGLTYIFQVAARGPAGEQGIPSRVLVHRVEALAFSGLKTEGVVVAPDSSKVTLSWTAATGNKGTVAYIIYSDANFQNVLSTTTATTFEYLNPVKGQSYTFAVRAKDGSILDANQEFVVITIPDPSDKTPPVFAGIKSAETVSDKKLLLKWNASSSDDAALYNIYHAHNVNQAIASTADTYYMATNLSPATTYAFVVRAVDVSGNEDNNKVQRSAATLPYGVPDFAGLDNVERLGGTDGLSKLKLTWLPAGGAVTGYKIYMATASGSQVYTSPIQTLVDPNVTEVTIAGLDSGTNYYFVARAYDSSSGQERHDLNTVEKSNSTIEIKAPTFAGAATAVPEAGSLGLSSIKLTWSAPQTDGIYDGFVVSYEPGTCAQGFTGGATTVNVAGDTQRDYILSGLTAATTYRFRVRARYSVTGITDTNVVCRQAKTEPPAPIFTGLATLATAPGVQGFDSLTLTWPKAQSSFSYYKIEWSTTSNFAVVVGSQNITNIDTLDQTVSGLPSKTTLYVRVTATFDEGGVLLKAGQSKVMSAKTEPPVPTAEGVSTVTVMTADSLKVVWTAPTNPGAVYGGYKLWSYCGASAAANLIAKVAGGWSTADENYGAGQLEATFSGLSSNTQCCYQVRAYYDDGSYTLASNSTVAQKCATPTLTAPTFAGVTSVSNSNLATGFTQLTVNWSPVSAGQAGLFSFYEIDVAATSNGHTWSSPTQVADRTQTSYTLTGLGENLTHHVRVRAVNNNGSPAVHNGSNAVQSATTTPKTPTGDNLVSATSIASTKVLAVYSPPNADAAVGGLYNNVFFFIQAGAAADVTTYRNGIESGGVTSGEVTSVLASGRVTLSGAPAVVRIPKSELTAGNNNLEIWGLTPNQQVCIQSAAVYWVDGQAARYLKSASSTTRCVTPTAGAPTFAGVSALDGFDSSQDFSQIDVQWGTITGDCTRVDISVSLVPNAPDFGSPWATATCGESSKTIAGLTAHQEYFIQVRAVNEVGGTDFAAGQGVELSRFSRPTLPTGDTTSNALATSVLKAPDEIALTYVEATAGMWNKTYIWKATGATQSAAEAAVRAAAVMKVDNSGPTSAPFAIKAPGNSAHTDTDAVAGTFACYLARSVFEDGTNYSASTNDVVKCARPNYSSPSFSGLAATGSAVTGVWPDGKLKIELKFPSAPAGSIEEYEVFFSESSGVGSFDFNSPLVVIDHGDPSYDSNPNDPKIEIPAPASLVDGYFIVRIKFFGGPAADVDGNTAVSNLVTALPGRGGFVFLPKSLTGLAYSFWLMRYEASWTAGGSQSGSDAVTATEADLATCQYQLHVNKVSSHASCGTRVITKTPQSVAGVTPLSNVTFPEAFYGCRNGSDASTVMRLPTSIEWQRAGRHIGSDYQAMWDVYSNNAASNCFVSGGAPSSTGSGSNCQNALKLFDLAGNVKEWVDSRMVRYDISDPAGDGTSGGNDVDNERRFGYGPVIGRTLQNGVDNLTRRYHAIDPGASGLALAMGADFTTPPVFSDRKRYGESAQNWLAPSTSNGSTGFRCVAFPHSATPSMTQLAVPDEPTYVAADVSGAASTWKIPENFYVKDVRPEEVVITVNGNTTDAVAEGKVNISWKPWAKTVCPTGGGSCASDSTGITYQLYRFIEPTRTSIRGTTPWALAGGSNNPYMSDKQMDPLAVSAAGVPFYSSSTTDGKLIATVSNCDTGSPANCTFEDSTAAGTGFSARRLYNYILVAQDASGNQQTAQQQRYLSPWFAGDPAVAGAASFRMEPRFRRAGVFLVDEFHQQAESVPQIMVHVPMDLSGLDHDFFIQKYKGANGGGSFVNENPAGSSEWPRAADGAGVWRGYSSACYDGILRTGTFNVSNCGNGTQVNATTGVVMSKRGVSHLITVDQGAFWMGCARSTVTGEGGATYSLYLPSNSEWMKAADMGDLNLDDTIDVNPVGANVGQTVSFVEYGAATGCSTTGAGIYNSNSSNTAACRSRYNAADMTGNQAEFTLEKVYNGVGYDNGVDGLWLGQAFPTTSGSFATVLGGAAKYDLLRGLPKSGLSTIPNQDYYFYTSGLRAAIRGGGYNDAGSAGRWTLRVLQPPSSAISGNGGRCRR
jgi:formylglycine-generating enzyme required for sulfatase activity